MHQSIFSKLNINDYKLIYSTLKDLRELGILTKKWRRNRRRKTKTNNIQQNPVKSDSSHMIGYSNAFSTDTKINNLIASEALKYKTGEEKTL